MALDSWDQDLTLASGGSQATLTRLILTTIVSPDLPVFIMHTFFSASPFISFLHHLLAHLSGTQTSVYLLPHSCRVVVGRGLSQDSLRIFFFN